MGRNQWLTFPQGDKRIRLAAILPGSQSQGTGLDCFTVQFSSFQSLSHVWFFATPWTAARQASLSITNSQSLLKLVSIESVMPSNHLISCPQSFPAARPFSMSQFFVSGGHSIGVSASASVLPVNNQDWFPWELTGLILQSKGFMCLLQQFFCAQLFL